MRFIRILATALLVLGVIATGVSAQAFPDRPIKLIVPFPPGGATDTLGRILGKKMAELLGQPVVIENHGGAGGTIGFDYASRQPADGYTVVLANAFPHTAAKKMYGNLKYDPVKSFVPVGSLGTVSYVLVVNPSFPANDLATFVKVVRASPGKYNFASSGVGTAPHLVFELFLRAADLNVVHVPFQGSGPAMTAILGGDVQMALDNTATVPLIKAGKLRGLAQTGKRRSQALPDVPTFAEAGMPQFDATGSWGLLAPAGTPDKAIAVLGDALSRAVNDPTVRETLLSQGITPESGTAQQFAAVLQSESDKWSKLIEEAGIKAQ